MVGIRALPDKVFDMDELEVSGRRAGGRGGARLRDGGGVIWASLWAAQPCAC